MNKLLTFKQTSQALAGRSIPSLYRDVAAKRLPKPIAIGGRKYFKQSDIDAIINGDIEAGL